MADYSFDELYPWLRERARTLNWGMVCFMDRDKLNLLLLQAYIQRFKTSAYLPPVTGSIPHGDDLRFALNAFTLDWPRLSFASTQSNDSRARLHMQVMSGTQLGLARIGNNWEVREIRETGPLQGPLLGLDLLLARVPGVVGEEGRLRLDLKCSADFSMDLSNDPVVKGLVGEYFRQKFEALPDDQRVFPLGQIEAGVHPLLRAASFALRTQARKRDPEDEEGAVLAMVCFEGSTEGNLPGNDFRYLVPHDRDYNAAVLFAPERVMLAQLTESLKSIVENLEFELVLDGEGNITGAVAKTGRMVIAEHIRKHKFDTDPENGPVIHVTVELKVHDIVLEVKDALSVSINGNHVEIVWEVVGEMSIEPVSMDSDDGRLAKALDSPFFDTSDFYESSSDDFSYTFTCTYALEDIDGGRLSFIDLSMDEIKAPAPPVGEIKPLDPKNTPPELKFFLIFLMFYMTPILVGIAWVVRHIFKALSDAEYPSVESILIDAFEKDFQFSQSLRALIDETVKLNFGNALIGQDQFAPRDIAFYGVVNPAFTAFAIEPMEHTLMAGGAPKPFATLPDQSGQLHWTCEPVLDSVSSEKIGHIDPRSGVYTPPDASDFDGAFVRLRVNAQHTQNGFRSSALITVLKRPLQINPLLYVTYAEGEVPLQAGYLGDSKDLRWSTPTHGQLSPSGLTAVYKGPTTMPPLDDKSPHELAAFTVDEVVLSNSSAEQTALLITESATKPPMTIRREVNAEAGTVQLTAVINDYVQDPKTVKWVLRGPGQIDCDTGVYTHDKSSQEPFALITATRNTDGLGIYHGYVVQTLPPAKLEDAVLGIGAFEVRQGPEQATS